MAGATKFGYSTNVTQTVQRATRLALRGLLVMVLMLCRHHRASDTAGATRFSCGTNVM